MKISPKIVIEKLDDGSAVLLNIEKEMVYILNETGYLVLDTATNCEKKRAQENYFNRLNISVSDEYLSDYNCCLEQLKANDILLEE